MPYDLIDTYVPPASGPVLKLGASLLEKSMIGWAVEKQILKAMGFEAIDHAVAHEPPTYFLQHKPRQNKVSALSLEDLAQQAVPPEQHPFRYWRVVDYAKAYRDKTITPLVVAERVIDAIKRSDDSATPLRIMINTNADDILAQARASSERFEEGVPLGLFDGVPVAVKDEMDQMGYPTTVGTSFLGKHNQEADAFAVRCFRDAGALLIGKTNMHEIGIGVTGMNPHFGHARNPFNPNCITGGSSSGSAASVAAGLCPVAIGADAGGSIRIPSGLCGVFGLKPTFGSISDAGAFPLSWTLDQIGPIAATIQDTALAYALMAGKGPAGKLGQSINLNGLDNLDLDGIKVGIFQGWFEHAEPEIVQACRKGIESLVSRGASVVPIEIPDLNLMRAAHGIIVASEMAAALDAQYPEHQRAFGLDVRINLAISRRFRGTQYIKAQQIRTRALNEFNKAFEKVDVIATPTTACVAVPIEENAIPDGASDLTLLFKLMRYMFVGNLIGVPALSMPVGYNPSGIPIGLQVMGRPYEENLLLRLGGAIEQDIMRAKPSVFFDLLNP